MDRRAILAIPILAVILISGCIGGEQPTGKQPSSQSSVGQSGTESEKPTGPLLTEILETKQLAGFTIVYSLTGTGKNTQSATMKQIVKDNKSKFETTAMIEGQTVVTQIYHIGDKNYMCSTAQGRTLCFETPMASTASQNAELKATQMATAVPYDHTKIIAGLLVHCYRTTQNDQSLIWCYDPISGLMLGYYSTMPDSTISIEAVSIDTTMPSDSEFVLPAQPTKIIT